MWYDLFGEYLSQDVYKFILISTDNFRPKNLMIGQGAICAESKEDALDWLKIIKTAFILSDTNKQDLDYNNFKSNFKFDDIDEFSSSSSFSTSGFETLEENDIFNTPKDDGFIYNERFEGNDDSNDSIIDDDLFSNAFIDESKKEDINVFNLKSLKSIEDEDEDSSENPSYSNSEEDYDYDDEEMKDDEEEEIYNAFSNLWG